MCILRPSPPERSRADKAGLRLVDEASQMRRLRMYELHRAARWRMVFQISVACAVTLSLCAWAFVG